MIAAGDTASAPPPPDSSLPPPPRLTRSTDDKVVSGLCGGLGRHFGVDPVVFRIAFVVLALAGGSGLLLYLVGWIMVPDDRSGAAVFDRARHGRSSQLVAALLVGVGVIVAFDLGFGGDDGDGGGFVGLVLLCVGAAVLWSRRDRGGLPPAGGGPDGGDAPVPPTWAPPPPQPISSASVDPGPPPAGAADVTEPIAVTAGGIPAPPTVSPPAAPPPPPPPPPPVRPRRPPSILVPVTLSLLAILGGVLALLGATDTLDLSGVVVLALPLLLIGAALCVGAWRGRARWLIPLGAVLSVGLLAVAVVDVPIRGGIGDRSFRPRTVSELQSPYRLAAGDLVIDLGAVNLGTASPRVVASLGAGDLEVVVPDGAEVVVDFHAGAGAVSVFGREWDGMGTDHRITAPGREGGGRLVLEVSVGFGNLEVRRASS